MTIIKFISPHENTIKKRGNFTCVWCRKEGVKKLGEICTYRKSISWRKETCSCEEHRHLAIESINQDIESDNQELTEADYQTWMRL